MRKYNIIQAIETLYSNAKSAVLFNSSTGDLVSVQGCLLSPTLFNIFIEGIVSDVLEDDKGSVSNWRSDLH